MTTHVLPIPPVQFQWIDKTADLQLMVNALQHEPAIALDTEFIRTDTFFPQVGLIQIATDDQVYLIDPLAFDELSLLKPLIYNQNGPVLVLHSCSEDLEVFKTLWGQVPERIFDTQIATAFAGIDRQLGLQKLLKILLDIDLPKGETRSNWLQRPLTQSQLDYAALDVVYLLAVYRQLVTRLEALDRMHWVKEECELLCEKYSKPIDPDSLYRNVSNAWRLQPKQLAALKPLAAWRELMAIKTNRPKNRILKDSELYGLAEQLPETQQLLSEKNLLTPNQIKRYGDDVLDIVKRAINSGQQSFPPALDKPFSKHNKSLLKALRETIEKQANELGIAAEKLANRKMLETFLRCRQESKALPGEFHGWRQAAVVRYLDDVLSS